MAVYSENYVSMTERENKCFKELGGRWGEEHSRVLKWADEHPVSPWKNPKVDGMPVEEGQYLVLVNGLNGAAWPEVCYHGKNKKSFICWDSYNDCECLYKQKDVKLWMKIPDFK